MVTTNFSTATARTESAQARRALRDLIERGVYAPGERLPAERELALLLGVARHAVRQVVAEMVEQGVIVTNGARMRFVSETFQAKGLLCKAVFSLSMLSEGPREDHRESGWSDWLHIGLQKQLHREGWHYLALHPNRLKTEWQRIVAERPMGIAISNVDMRNPAVQHEMLSYLLGEFQQAQIPVVIYGDEPDWQKFDRVASDHFSGSAMLTRHFLERGQHEIAMVCGPNDGGYNWFKARRAGHQAALRAADVEPLPLLTTSCSTECLTENSFEADVQILARDLALWFERHPRTEVFQLVCDALIPPFGEALRRLGKVPNRDVWLAGYDNFWRDLAYYTPDRAAPCVTVDKRNEACGGEMMRLLRQRIEGQLPDAPQLRLLEPRLIAL